MVHWFFFLLVWFVAEVICRKKPLHKRLLIAAVAASLVSYFALIGGVSREAFYANATEVRLGAIGMSVLAAGIVYAVRWSMSLLWHRFRPEI